MIEKYVNAHLQEELFFKRAASGLDMYIVPKKGFSKTFVYFAVSYGGMDSHFILDGRNETLPGGVAHFLEHKLFESKESNLFAEFNQRGASVNAFTNANSTVYHFACTESVAENITALMSFVQKISITESEVDKERDIIAEEIAMYEDQPDWQIYQQALKCIFSSHPIRQSIAGDKDDISRIQLGDLEKCYHAFYTPHNCFVLVVGDVSPPETFKVIERAQHRDFMNRTFLVERIDPNEPRHVAQERLEMNFPVTNTKTLIGFKEKPLGLKGKALYRHVLVSKLMNDMFFGKASLLYNRLYQMGQINGTFGIDYLFDKTYGFTLLGGDNLDSDGVMGVIRAYASELEAGVLEIDAALEAQFERLKKKTLGRYLMSFNSLEFIGHQYVTHIMKGINPMDSIDLMATIEIEDVLRRFLSHIVNNTPAIVTLKSNQERANAGDDVGDNAGDDAE